MLDRLQQNSNREGSAPGKSETDTRTSGQAPAISLPKGGGAIRGIGEKFAANPVTGTGSMTVPIAVSPGRSGFGPQLSLSYDSGAGNGPFGFGWNLSLPSITRKTDKGLPQYQDAEESDVFILSGAEDLVPVLQPDGSRFEDNTTAPGYTIHRYRPRIEGLFARIERWTNVQGEIHWRSISRDNITTLYGVDNNSRIFDPTDPDPAHPTRIFSWLICETRDDMGNAVIYEYKPEDGVNVDLTQAHERNRGDRDSLQRQVNRYLKCIRYGNHASLLDNEGRRPRFLNDADLQDAGWMFEVVFDYGEHDSDNPKPNDAGQWLCRHDAFSAYRAGFEVRTNRLCQRALMFHHFPSEAGVGTDCLVRSTDFVYRDIRNNPEDLKKGHPVASFIASVTQSGYKRQTGGGYLKKSLPPLEFDYSQAVIHEEVQEIDAESLENLPTGLDGGTYQWVDLDGEGVSGILTEQGNAWFYKPNLGEGRFGPLETVAVKPSLAAFSSGRGQLLDLAGDGQLDLAEFSGPTPGFYERTHDENWENFKPFASLPAIPWAEPNLRFVDLNGDGHADVLITENDVFTWYPSLAEKGFGEAQYVRTPLDEEKGPRLAFADGTQSIYLTDMSGDGLTDLARIRNGEVCYWPNLGYGRFGAKVTMDNAPWFDNPDLFDQRRVRLADIDGSGNTDLLYLGGDGVRIYLNQSGNRWSEARRLSQFPQVDNLSSVMAVDLLGNGTACLVWSSPLPGNARRPMRYIDLMGGQKPHLLLKTVNNLGAETRVQYAPSTRFYLEDKEKGKPWVTRLPFPVHVVERVETRDHISRNRFVTRYAYHHGYFDGVEREFRGFGMVEQRDTEEFAALSASGVLTDVTNLDPASHVPPVLTRTWFHTGAFIDRDHISDFFAGMGPGDGEYYREPALRGDDAHDPAAKALLLSDTVLPPGLTLEEEREACRALKGAMLRQEVYALDGTPNAEHPYTVTEQNFTIERLQPSGGNRHAVFFTHPREAIQYHYERNPADPRISHAMTLEVDPYGNVLKSLAIGYGRWQGQSPLQDADKEKQEQPLITYTENEVTNPIDDNAVYPDDYRTPLPCEARTYEVTGFALAGGAVRFSFNEFADNNFQALLALPDIEYEQPTDYAVKQKRLIECVRTLYREDNLSGLLGKGALEPMALPGESYKLAFTPGLLDQVYVRSGQKLLPANPADVLEGGGAEHGGYVDLDSDGYWWIPSGRVFHSPNSGDTAAQELTHARQHFFLPHRYRDPFHTTAVSTESFVTYDAYDLLMLETRDPLGNRVTVGERDPAGNLTLLGNDYRVLQPRLVMDANRNRTTVAFDALGMVVGTAVMGKPGEHLGDSLDTFEADLTDTAIAEHLRDPFADPHAILQRATTRLVYDLFAYHRTKDQADPQPAVVYTLARETHDAEPGGQQTKIQHSFSYSDGFGREIQKKIQAEPGPIVEGGPEVSPRWVGSGWTVFNNKGKPVRQYEPFFTDTHRFEFGVQVGVSPVLYYDPVERVVATLHPNHTWEKVVFDPWRQETWDVNDTVLVTDPKTDPDVGDFFSRLPDADYLPTWYAQRQGGALGTQEQAAARQAAIHAETPTVAHADPLGRTFLTVAHNKFKYSDTPLADPPTEAFHSTRVLFDIEGNQREIIDAKDRVVMRYDYDMLGNRIHQASMEAGERWMLNDVAGKPLYGWDSRNHQFRTTYAPLRRPTDSFLREGAGAELLVGRSIYGETRPSPEAANLRGKVVQLFDQAGVVTGDDYDFKGNLLRSQRQLAQDYKTTLDWAAAVPLEADTYTSRTRYDALNRPLTVTTPDQSVYRPTFNEANLLDKVDVNLRGEQENGQAKWTPFVININYNAKGQRELIEYGCGAGPNRHGVTTTYTYDKDTFRLTHLKTTRPAELNGLASQLFADATVVQDLRYTYDPAGNITRIEDAALKTIIHNGEQVDPVSEYTYDALYRLIEARGREHIGQTAHDFNPPDGNRRDYPFVGLRAHPNDMQAMRNYTERYEYDAIGNFELMRHSANSGSWTRDYEYDADSLVEVGKQSNRLTQTTVGNGLNHTETYTYTDAQGNDVHGCMTTINSMTMVWDFEDQLQQVDLGGGGTAYYVYDAAGQRVRKVWEKSANLVEERIYLGGFEVFRRRNGAGAVTLARETLHIMDDQQRIALVETRTIDTTGNDPAPPQLIRYQFGNHLGSASLELDDQAQIISYEEYTPYGSTSYQAVRSQTETPKRYRYTGMERDEESGMYYHEARFYVPWLGRWTSCDPVTSTNLYVYASCSPAKLNDPNGMSPEDSLTTGSYSTVRGDHVHQVASRTAKPGAKRTSAPQYKESLSVSTKAPSYVDKAGQKVESAINRAVWGKDYDSLPAGKAGKVRLTSTGATGVGKTGAATPSTWLEDVKSYYKLREAGVPPDDALKLVNQSSEQLNAAGATPKRGPQPPRSTPSGLKAGQTLSVEAKASSLFPRAASALPTFKAAGQALAPVARTAGKALGKALGPVGIGFVAYQVATAETTEEKVDAGISVVSTGLLLSKNPVLMAGGAGLAVGQIIAPDASDWSSSAGMYVNEGLQDLGLNKTASFVIGGAASLATVPVTAVASAGKKVGQGAVWAAKGVGGLVSDAVDFWF